MAYQTLEKLMYMDASSNRFARHEELLRARVEGESTFRTGIMLEHGELFCAVPRELSLANEQVLCRERRVSSLWQSLPVVARGACVRSLIMDEVVSSNEIEGVHSTRRQIEAALDVTGERLHGRSSLHTPFVEMAHLYLGLADSPAYPRELRDIRRVYESVVRGTLDDKNVLGEALFRSGPVFIENAQGRRLHAGITPESAIEDMLFKMLRLMESENVPEMYAALLGHFIFEYAHPFYDGNGRTGRYLLALSLSRSLALPTILSLSRTIAENKSAYYKAFDVTESPLNCAEGTHFVLAMMRLVALAQEDVIADLSKKLEALERLEAAVGLLAERSERERQVFFFMGQMRLFDAFGSSRAKELTDYVGVSMPTLRKTMAALVEEGAVEKVSSRPLAYRLSEQGLRLLGMG